MRFQVLAQSGHTFPERINCIHLFLIGLFHHLLCDLGNNNKKSLQSLTIRPVFFLSFRFLLVISFTQLQAESSEEADLHNFKVSHLLRLIGVGLDHPVVVNFWAEKKKPNKRDVKSIHLHFKNAVPHSEQKG